ncbi:MAG: anthranilate synthase component I family protein [Verrucomicrobiales bacterium]|nr:anthranilate synthase component I family protein [Verrucomicrobiales bacterium]
MHDHATARWHTSSLEAPPPPPPLAAAAPPPALRFAPQLDAEAFISRVRRAQAYIAAGDIYQVNLAYPWTATCPPHVSSLHLYHRLRAASAAPHAAFAELADCHVLSASPELFLRLSGRRVTTRPIKGTRPRFPTDPTRDAAARAELLASEKERAELLMITDLERNDLGRVCEFGSVKVPALWQVETFPQVFHLVSTVTGHLAPGISHAAAFRACFPGGSITGAPKKRALEIIHELEPHPRGLYTGAIGGFAFSGESFWNIAIRTAVRIGSTLTFHTGAGIVADSDPTLEYEETQHKAAGLLAAWS